MMFLLTLYLIMIHFVGVGTIRRMRLPNVPHRDKFKPMNKTADISDEHKLLLYILQDYDKSVRPIYNASTILTIEVGLTLTHIFKIDEKNQVLSLTIWLEQEWMDERFRWNASDFGDIEQLTVPTRFIWTPDIVLYNNADDYHEMLQTNVAVWHNGVVLWAPPLKLRSMCKLDVSYFPFDEQMCHLVFGSWIYDGRQVDVTNRSGSIIIDRSTYVDNGEWEILQTAVRRRVTSFSSFPTALSPELIFTIHLRRRTSYYMYNIVIPCVMLSCLTLVQFWLPSESGEKITLGLTVLLAYSVFSLNVGDSLPETSEVIPLLAIYIMCIMGISAISVTLSVIVLNIHHTDQKELPPWLRFIAYRIIAPLLFWRSDRSKFGEKLSERAVKPLDHWMSRPPHLFGIKTNRSGQGLRNQHGTFSSLFHAMSAMLHLSSYPATEQNTRHRKIPFQRSYTTEYRRQELLPSVHTSNFNSTGSYGGSNLKSTDVSEDVTTEGMINLSVDRPETNVARPLPTLDSKYRTPRPCSAEVLVDGSYPTLTSVSDRRIRTSTNNHPSNIVNHPLLGNTRDRLSSNSKLIRQPQIFTIAPVDADVSVKSKILEKVIGNRLARKNSVEDYRPQVKISGGTAGPSANPDFVGGSGEDGNKGNLNKQLNRSVHPAVGRESTTDIIGGMISEGQSKSALAGIQSSEKKLLSVQSPVPLVGHPLISPRYIKSRAFDEERTKSTHSTTPMNQPEIGIRLRSYGARQQKLAEQPFNTQLKNTAPLGTHWHRHVPSHSENSTFLTTALSDALKRSGAMLDKFEVDKTNETFLADWHNVARIFDQFFFGVMTIVTGVFTVSMLIIIPLYLRRETRPIDYSFFENH